ncbi:MAG: Ig-like domain repeat protein [Methanobrevibacter sp.]|jgi:hypothetical protein|nr:Ig-like domain repeat protein [Methanobrevibacter sp.]
MTYIKKSEEKSGFIILILFIAIFLLIIPFLCLISDVNGANLAINNTTDGGIKEAVNQSGDNDTIYLDDGIYSGDNNTGIFINKTLTIVGKSKNKTIIGGQAKNNFLTINGSCNVVLINISFINGGSIVHNPNGNLTIIHCNFVNNNASCGGAIFNIGGSLTILNSDFINNTSPVGGAIYSNISSIIISKTNFINNSGNQGGAIFAETSSLTLNDSNFINNHAIRANGIKGDGGVIYSFHGDLNISNSNFINNSATIGGAVYTNYIDLIIDNSTFINNSVKDFGGYSGDGGAIYLFSTILKLNNSNFIYNSANIGGVIYADNCNLTIINSNFTNNSANIFIGFPGEGGAIRTYYSSLTVLNSNFLNNRGNVGGAIYATSAKLTLNNSNFINNSVDNYNRYLGDGGAIYIYFSNFTLNNSNFINNSANMGGAISIDASNLTVSDSNFINNDAHFYISLGGYGGAIYSFYNSFLIVKNSNFSKNTASKIGGAIVLDNATGNITESNFLLNSAPTATTIAATSIYYPSTNSTLYLNYNRIIDNSSTVAVYINNNSSLVKANIDYNWWGNNTFDSNIAPNNYYVMRFFPPSIYGKKIGDIITIEYALVLNGTTNTKGSDKLPLFTVTVSDNGTIKSIADGRKVTKVNVSLKATNNSYKAQADNGVVVLDLVLSKIKTTLTVAVSTIFQGKNTNIQVILKDEFGKAISGQIVTITINKKNYSKTTNNMGLATFAISGLKKGVYEVNAKYNGDQSYLPVTKNATQLVKAIITKKEVDLAITKIKKLKSKYKTAVVYKLTIKNLGTKKSKKTKLNIQHLRKNGFKSKIKVKKVKVLGAGKKVTYKITFFHDNDHHRLCYKQVFTLNPKKTQKELTYKNNKKVLKK